jgi:hypothetical protein
MSPGTILLSYACEPPLRGRDRRHRRTVGLLSGGRLEESQVRPVAPNLRTESEAKLTRRCSRLRRHPEEVGGQAILSSKSHPPISRSYLVDARPSRARHKARVSRPDRA